MSVDTQDVRTANARADAARERFRGALAFAKTRASPSRIKQDVIDGAKTRIGEAEQAVQTTVRRHPVAISSAVAGLLAFLFRKPLATLAGKGWEQTKELKQRLDAKRKDI